MSESDESDIDYQYHEDEDFKAERDVLERVAQQVDDPKTFDGALRIANRNLDNYNITVSESIVANIISIAETKIPNYKTKNPYACILSYMCIKDSEINKETFSHMSKIVNKFKDLNIKVEDLVRYCRMWLTYN